MSSNCMRSTVLEDKSIAVIKKPSIVFLEHIENGCEIKNEQIIEEQTDLQMIVETIGNSGETEVILEAYSEEADPSNIGWLQATVVEEDGNGTDAEQTAREVHYQYQIINSVAENDCSEHETDDNTSKEENYACLCELCNSTFRSPTLLTQHIMTNHAGKRPFACEFCGLSFCERQSMEKHLLNHMTRSGENYVCCYCAEILNSLDIRSHLHVHLNNKRKVQSDLDAEDTEDMTSKTSSGGSTEENLQTQIEFDQNTNQKKCKICNKIFTEKSNIRRHMQVHSGERPFECEICGKRFADKSNWSHHIGSHSGIMKHSCEECGKQFPEAKQFKKHLSTHSAKANYNCRLCGKVFKFSQALKNHLNIHAGLRPFLCDLCGKGFRNQAALRYHSMIHTGESIHHCEVCGKGFIQLKALREHVMVRHSNDRPYVCNTCGKGFPSNPVLKVHLNSHNDNREMFKCETCFKSFTTAGSLKVHNRLHSGELAFECEVCHERFTTTAKRRLHMFDHVGKPYGCDFCDKRFITRKEHDIHVLTHTGQKPHTCPVCQKGFIRIHHMKRHQSIHQK